jgi:hypothetical protein
METDVAKIISTNISKNIYISSKISNASFVVGDVYQ